MQSLQPMTQHGAIGLFKNVSPDLDNKIRTNAEKEIIEGCVVQLAQGYTISNN